MTHEQMTDERAAEVLAAHNEWRRYGGEAGVSGAPVMGCPAEIGRAIDHMVARVRAAPKPPAEAQPVAWLVRWQHGRKRLGITIADSVAAENYYHWRNGGENNQPVELLPLYTAPPSSPVGVDEAKPEWCPTCGIGLPTEADWEKGVASHCGRAAQKGGSDNDR